MLFMIWQYLRPSGADIQVSYEPYSNQVALEYPWVLTNVTMANDDGVEIAHIQMERVALLDADTFS